MKRVVVLILVTLLILSFFMADALALNAIPLHFSYSPIELGHVYWLPNGSYLVEYFRLNTSEFWHNLGRDDIRRHVTEIFASSGQSVFCCTEGEEIFPEKIDDYLFQYAVYPDSFLREMYWDGSMQNYFTNTWSFDGTVVVAPSEPIHQEEEEARYIESQYPYTLELYPFGADYQRSTELTYVLDGSRILLPFGYGERSSAVTSSGNYCMIYDNTGSDGKIHFLQYDPQYKTLKDYPSSLSTASGKLAVLSDTIYLLTSEYSDKGYSYALHSSIFPSDNADSIDFAIATRFQLEPDSIVDDIIPIGDQLLFLVTSRGADDSSCSSLNILSSDDFMIPVYTWDHEVRYIERANAGYIQLITPNATNDGYQVMLFSNEDIAHFLTYLDHAQ